MDRELLDRVHVPLKVKNAVAELHGVASSIIYDQKITDVEISFLNEWIGENQQYCVSFPLKDLLILLEKIQEDGEITDVERRLLFDFLAGLTKPAKRHQPPKGIFTENPAIVFSQKRFAFTGDMKWGEREQAVEAVRSRDGYCDDRANFTLKTNYLVVGSKGSEYWKHKGFGTKVEKAMQHINQGRCSALIVQENDFVRALI